MNAYSPKESSAEATIVAWGRQLAALSSAPENGPPAKSWFTITNRAISPCAEIDILDEIGAFGITAKVFADALKAVPTNRDITVRINSPGGSVFDGFAIFNLLAERRDKVTCKIIGLAASMASVIAIAGKRTIATENSTIMIHNPAMLTLGESRDMRESADLLDKLRGPIANAYVAKSGKSEAVVTAAMDTTTWFTAAEAKAWGLIDEVTAAVKVDASFDLARFGLTQPSNRPSTESIWAKQFARNAPGAKATPVPAVAPSASTTHRLSSAEIWAKQFRSRAA